MKIKRVKCGLYVLKSQGLRVKKLENLKGIDRQLELRLYEEDDSQKGFSMFFRIRQDQLKKAIDAVVIAKDLQNIYFEPITRKIEPWLSHHNLNALTAGPVLYHHFLERKHNALCDLYPKIRRG